MHCAFFPVSKVKCHSPPVLYDAISTERIRRRYKVGDVVTFKCKTGIEIERRICLADGSWSGGNFVCGSTLFYLIYQDFFRI